MRASLDSKAHVSALLRRPRGSSLRTAPRLAWLVAAVLVASTSVACGGDDPKPGSGGSGGGTSGTGGGSGGAGGGTFCEGGVVTAEGACVAKCEDAKCIADNLCVGNACALKCSAHTDCAPDGSQTCAAVAPDYPEANGPSVFVCAPNDKVPGPGYVGTSCPFGDECTDFACPNGAKCDRAACGDPIQCERDPSCGDDPFCVRGTCKNNGTPCIFPMCNLDDCSPTHTTCNTEGSGDASAYCTQLDCKTDDDCTPGYYCGAENVPNDMCGNTCVDSKCSHAPTVACETDGDCQKGNNGYCGTVPSGTPCLDPKDFQANGTNYFEGPICVMRKVCLKKESCTPCETDLDCSLVPGQTCTDFAGGKVCAARCNLNFDCSRELSCEAGACLPKFGACSQKNAFCAPCRDDSDCGDPDPTPGGPRWACVDTNGKAKACLDLSFSTSCTTDKDCPQAPNGRYGACLDEDDQVAPGDSVYHKCYLPHAPTADFTDGDAFLYSCY